MKKICIVGLGSFGLALLKHLNRKFSHNQVEIIGYSRRGEATLQTSIEGAEYIILAIGSNTISEVVGKLRECITKPVVIVNTAKALDHRTGDPFSKVVREILYDQEHTYALLAGATRAVDLIQATPLGTHIACKNEKLLPQLVELFGTKEFTVIPTTDISGVEYAAAFKNILAIFSGILHGYGYSLETEIFAVTRMACEIEVLIMGEFGGQKDTFLLSSPSWGNDVWMSCTSVTRNRELGVLIGKGKSVAEVLVTMEMNNKTVEGVFTIKVLNKITQLHKYPFLQFMYEFFEGSTSLHKIKTLLENKLV